MLKEKLNDFENDYKSFKIKMASFVVEKPKPRVRKTIQVTDEEDQQQSTNVEKRVKKKSCTKTFTKTLTTTLICNSKL